MGRAKDDKDRPLFMISVAAELAGMHPQTLRIYERRCLINPKRSAGNTRLYSQADIERLRFIQRLTQEEGINLAGTARIMELMNDLDRARREAEEARAAAEEAGRRLVEETERVRRSYKAEIVLVRRGGLSRRRED
ncbi:MAG TPA: MerR family transcriptional regulator [Coriobacteriia bacterium]|jgi:MerR family transcriptional regulator/heat shock protein HspR